MTIFDTSVDSVFFPSDTQAGQRENLAQRALNSGLEAFTKKKYDEAIVHLKRAVGLAPASSSAINAYDYIAKSYISQGNTQAAIDTYRQSIRTDPAVDATHTSLANLFYSEERYDEALAEYQQAVKVNPSAANRYSLGQGYLATGRYADAEAQFSIVHGMESNQPHGSFGLGQAYAKQARYDRAIEAFERAIEIRPDYWDAHSEMGYALADSGNLDKAQEVADQLAPENQALATMLNSYIGDKRAPKMTATYTTDLFKNFLATLGPRLPVSLLGGNLYQADGQQTLAMIFQFDKPMDRGSVENVGNWNISRDTGTGKGDGYNFGHPAPNTEVTPPSTPLAVIYDSTKQTATVLFKITQNAAANGTIDPSHIKFSFKGMDELGVKMDKRADEYTGFSGFA